MEEGRLSLLVHHSLFFFFFFPNVYWFFPFFFLSFPTYLFYLFILFFSPPERRSPGEGGGIGSGERERERQKGKRKGFSSFLKILYEVLFSRHTPPQFFLWRHGGEVRERREGGLGRGLYSRLTHIEIYTYVHTQRLSLFYFSAVLFTF